MEGFGWIVCVQPYVHVRADQPLTFQPRCFVVRINNLPQQAMLNVSRILD